MRAKDVISNKRGQFRFIFQLRRLFKLQSQITHKPLLLLRFSSDLSHRFFILILFLTHTAYRSGTRSFN
ncbi:hypothetical protein P8452_20928 [Trifolium repens]|nr:hypothetical protein P8452_20928 [Trifolium repens]